jgi:hypothetical protein
LRSVLAGRLAPLVLAGLLLAAAPVPAHAQGKATGQFMNEAVVRVTDLAARANFINYGYNDGVSILGGWVDEKAHLTFTTPLAANVEYLFLAGGDNDAADVDLEILDDRGNVLAADLGVAPDAVVQFRPKVQGTYTLRMTLFKSRNSVPCVCVTTILRKNGWNLPVKNLDKATGKIMRALEGGDQAAQRQGLRVDLRRASNQWAFYGGVLRQGDNLAVKNLDLGRGDRLFVGAGDDFASVVNVDLENNNAQALKRDGKQGPVSVIDYGANGGTYGLRVHNRRATGPAVVLMAVLDIR